MGLLLWLMVIDLLIRSATWARIVSSFVPHPSVLAFLSMKPFGSCQQSQEAILKYLGVKTVATRFNSRGMNC
jgi:hypothetical protein